MPQNHISKHITANNCYLKQDARIVFVCGRDIKSTNSKRKILLEYADKHINDAHFLLAEDVFRAFDHGYGDLLSIEEHLATYSDCIIIILESESAFTELGAFAIRDDLCRLIIPINDILQKDSLSFISLGPLRKINEGKSIFGQTIYTSMDTFSNCFPEVRSRLRKIILNRRKKLKLDTYTSFQECNKERILLIHDIIGIMAPVKFKELIDLFKAIYGQVSRFDKIKLDLKLLEALNFITQIDGYYITKDSKNRFIDFGWDSFTTLKTKQIMKYKRHFPERLSILGRMAQDAT